MLAPAQRQHRDGRGPRHHRQRCRGRRRGARSHRRARAHTRADRHTRAHTDPLLVTLTHSGSSNFQVSLLDANGERVESLANEIGQSRLTFPLPVNLRVGDRSDSLENAIGEGGYQGRYVVPDGTFLLQIEARAGFQTPPPPWTLTVD